MQMKRRLHVKSGQKTRHQRSTVINPPPRQTHITRTLLRWRRRGREEASQQLTEWWTTPKTSYAPGLFNLLGGWAKRPVYFTEPQNFGISKNMSRAFLPQFMTLVSKATSWSHVIEECGEPFKNRFWSFPLQFYKGIYPNFFMLWDTANPRPLFPTAMGVLVWANGLGFAVSQSIKKLGILPLSKLERKTSSWN